MIGTYVFKQQGEILSVSKNVITSEGRKEILRFLAGQRGALGGTLGVGVGDTATSTEDKALALEFEKTPVTLSAPNFIDGRIIYKGLLSAESVGMIHEVGLWSSTILDVPIRNILSFDSRFETWTGGTWSPNNSRLGTETYFVAAAPAATTVAYITNFTQEVETYGRKDEFILGVYVNDPNCDVIHVRFECEGTGNHYQYSAYEITQGYNVIRFTKNDLEEYGIVSYNEVYRIMLRVKANNTDYVPGPEEDPIGYTGTRVYLDKLLVKVSNLEVDTNTLVSRSVLPGPVAKRAGVPMDIEYYLELNI